MESVVSSPKYLDPSEDTRQPRKATKAKGEAKGRGLRMSRQTADVTILPSGARKFQMRAIWRITAKLVYCCYHLVRLASVYFLSCLSQNNRRQWTPHVIYIIWVFNCFSLSTCSLFFSHFCKKERKKKISPSLQSTCTCLLPAQSRVVCLTMSLNCPVVGILNQPSVCNPHSRASLAGLQQTMLRDAAQLSGCRDSRLTQTFHASESSALALDSVSYAFLIMRIN